MSLRLSIQGEYPPDWPQIADRVRAEAGHRCIRCGHPYRTGAHGKGEWTPCDHKCRHHGPIAHSANGHIVPFESNETAAWHVRGGNLTVVAQWRVLTVHHFDGNKANCAWWNLLCLCQRCHLQIQSRVNPEVTYFLEHSDWAKPYIAGFYAWKYERRQITRAQAMENLNTLLAHERLL